MGKITGIDCYKVVTKDRESTFPTVWRRLSKSMELEQVEGMEYIITSLNKRRILKIYNKGSIIRAAKCAGPILCFSNFHRATDWGQELVGPGFKILNVRGFEKAPAFVIEFYSQSWREFLAGLRVSDISAPLGSLGFRRIKVLS